MKNKTVLITGGTTGIGFATAQLLAAQGAKVIVTGRNSTTLEAAKKALPSSAVVLRSDSASLEDARQLGAEVSKHTRTLDAAFLNAGIAAFLPLDQATPEHFESHFAINVQGPYFQLQSLLPLLANPSSVVITGSVVAQLGFPGASVYSATKAAVVSLGKTLAVELAPKGIRVNVISPGPIKTPIFDKMGAPAADQAGMEDHLASQSLLKRFGQPDEVAKAARFLLSSDSSYVVGSELLIDGGVRLT